MNTSNYRLIGDLRVGDTFRLNTGVELLVQENTTVCCDKCYFDDAGCDYSCPWFSVVDSSGQFRNILYCKANGNRSVYYEKVENPEDEGANGL